MTRGMRRRRIVVTPLVTLAAEVLHGVPLLPRAACRAYPPALFDGTTPDDVTAAIRICHGCRDIRACREWIAIVPQSRRPFGVVAGKQRRMTRTAAAQHVPPEYDKAETQ
jgi:hypothetical protein